MIVSVRYLDTLEGGSGSTTIALKDVPNWLAGRPGVLIRALEPVGGLEEMEKHDREVAEARARIAIKWRRR